MPKKILLRLRSNSESQQRRLHSGTPTGSFIFFHRACGSACFSRKIQVLSWSTQIKLCRNGSAADTSYLYVRASPLVGVGEGGREGRGGSRVPAFHRRKGKFLQLAVVTSTEGREGNLEQRTHSPQKSILALLRPSLLLLQLCLVCEFFSVEHLTELPRAT